MNITKKVWIIGFLIGLGLLLLPSASYTAAPYKGVGTWHIETVATDVRKNGSITVATNNNPALTYQIDGINGDELTYARWTGSEWEKEKATVLTVTTPSASLALDNNDIPHISYANCFGFACSAEYTYWTGSYWFITHNTPDGYGSLDIDTTNTVHVGYHHTASQNIRHMYLSGSNWIIDDDVDTDTVANPHTSLKTDGNNYPRISYYKGNSLYQAAWKGAIWVVQPVANNVGTAISLEGQHTSLAIDTNNHSHIAYYDGTNKDLKYARWTGSTWIYRTIDSHGDVGQYVSLALDSNNLPHFIYYDASNQAVKYAHQTDSGYNSWRKVTLDEGIGNGGATSLAIDDNDRLHLSYHYYGGPTERLLKYGRGDLATLFYAVNLPIVVR